VLRAVHSAFIEGLFVHALLAATSLSVRTAQLDLLDLSPSPTPERCVQICQSYINAMNEAASWPQTPLRYASCARPAFRAKRTLPTHAPSDQLHI
jgi:hypothetical protein